jgi:drug/metabolite transporter (DMT)-like permease
MKTQALPFVFLAAFLMGSTLVASRFSVGQFNPTTYIGLRLVMASGAHFAIYALSNGRKFPTDPRVWRRGVVLGIFGTAIPITTVVSSLQFLSSGTSAIILTIAPAVVAGIAHFTLPEEKLGWQQWGGVVVALGGVLILTISGQNGLPDMAAVNPIGYVLVIVTVVSGSCATIFARKQLREFDALDVATVRMTSAAVILMPLSIIFTGFTLDGVNGQGYFALVYAAFIGTFGGFFFHFYTIKRFGAISASMITYVIPFVAAIGGVLLLGETFTWVMILGAVVIFSGLALVQNIRLRRPA